MCCLVKPEPSFTSMALPPAAQTYVLPQSTQHDDHDAHLPWGLICSLRTWKNGTEIGNGASRTLTTCSTRAGFNSINCTSKHAHLFDLWLFTPVHSTWGVHFFLPNSRHVQPVLERAERWERAVESFSRQRGIPLWKNRDSVSTEIYEAGSRASLTGFQKQTHSPDENHG